MTAGERLFNTLADARAAFGVLNKEKWIAVADAFHAKEFPKGKRRATPKSALSDDEWIAELEASPAMEGIDVKREIGRCQFHFRGKVKVLSRRRIEAWLLRSERTFVKPMDGASSRKQVVGDIYTEPEGWQAVAIKIHGEDQAAVMISKGWFNIGVDWRRQILGKLL